MNPEKDKPTEGEIPTGLKVELDIDKSAERPLSQKAQEDETARRSERARFLRERNRSRRLK